MSKDYVKILLIEDDEDDYAMVRELLSGLSRADFYLEWVRTYGEGLKELCQAEHDAYLLDYRLGSRNGLELIREATGAGCDKPIIFLTGQGDHGVDIEAIRSGAADYLDKAQLTTDMLERSVRYSIARKESERELKSYRNHLEDLVKERTEQLETANEELQVEIAEHKRADEALQDSHSLLVATLESTADGILVVGTAGKVTSYNRSFLELWRIPETLIAMRDDEQLLQFVLDQLLNPDAFLDKVRSLYQTPDVSFMDEVVFKDGRIFERYSQPQRIEDTVVGRVWSFRDITERKRAEAALLESEQGVRRLNEHILNMVMVLSHDIRGPLVAIASTLKLMLRGVYGKLDQNPANTVQELLSRCARLLGTAEDYLGKASIVEGSLEMEREVLDLRQDIIDAVLDELADDITKREIVIDNRLGAIPSGSITISANKTWLKAVYRNLFSNAVKYGGKGCTISFGFEQRESHYRLNVYNSGRPIAEKIARRYFTGLSESRNWEAPLRTVLALVCAFAGKSSSSTAVRYGTRPIQTGLTSYSPYQRKMRVRPCTGRLILTYIRPLNGGPRVQWRVRIAGRRHGHIAATVYLEVPHETHKVFLLVYELRQNNLSCDGATLSVYDRGGGHRGVGCDRPPLPLQ